MWLGLRRAVGDPLGQSLRHVHGFAERGALLLDFGNQLAEFLNELGRVAGRHGGQSTAVRSSGRRDMERSTHAPAGGKVTGGSREREAPWI